MKKLERLLENLIMSFSTLKNMVMEIISYNKRFWGQVIPTFKFYMQKMYLILLIIYLIKRIKDKYKFRR